jgi:hypothetical protein
MCLRASSLDKFPERGDVSCGPIAALAETGREHRGWRAVLVDPRHHAGSANFEQFRDLLVSHRSSYRSSQKKQGRRAF